MCPIHLIAAPDSFCVPNMVLTGLPNCQHVWHQTLVCRSMLSWFGSVSKQGNTVVVMYEVPSTFRIWQRCWEQTDSRCSRYLCLLTSAVWLVETHRSRSIPNHCSPMKLGCDYIDEMLMNRSHFLNFRCLLHILLQFGSNRWHAQHVNVLRYWLRGLII